ncbi:MAG: hypothetical protein J5842_04320 [Lachnospiraceae bacterium]|nr:hypothetical protein [Lachnospiraceae bacterium]
MPFINSKVSVKMTQEQKEELKTKLGEAISIIPGKSETWLMVNLEDDLSMYFRGDDSQPVAFVGVNVYGDDTPAAYERMTAELTKIYGELLGIPADHMYVRYSASREWGWNGSNF